MYEKIKADIAQDYYRQNFPNDGQRFVAWYVRNIHGQDPNQTRYCVTDGADDKQIDAIVIDDEQSAIYIVQGNSSKTDSSMLCRCAKFFPRGYSSRISHCCKKTRIRASNSGLPTLPSPSRMDTTFTSSLS